MLPTKFLTRRSYVFNTRNVLTKATNNKKIYENDQSHYDNRQIFQIYPPICDVNLVNVEDCLEVCNKHTTYLHKKELFYSNGIDYDRVFQYHNYIERLNYVYYIFTDPDINNKKQNDINLFKKLWIIIQIVFHWTMQK